MLSPYVKTQFLNGGYGVPSKLSKVVYGTDDALDKRNDSAFANLTRVIDAAKDIADTTANMLGVRSPYFIIGEIPKTMDHVKSLWSNYDKASYGIIRAVSEVSQEKPTQEGVIIDCLGDVSGDMSVEFTSKPIFYLGSTIMDSRIRKPKTVRATIAISNNLSDDALGASMTIAANTDPTGLAQIARDKLLYRGYTRAQYGLYKLQWIMEQGVPFTLYTPHGYYKNMLIQSLKPQTNEESLDMLLCDVVYQEAILTAPYAGTIKELENRTPITTAIEPSTASAEFNRNYPTLKQSIISLFKEGVDYVKEVL